MISMAKLFYWSVDHVIRNRNGSIVKRQEKGVVRATDQESARTLLEKSVCTIFSRNLRVTEIPDKMTIYSLGHQDSIVKS